MKPGFCLPPDRRRFASGLAATVVALGSVPARAQQPQTASPAAALMIEARRQETRVRPAPAPKTAGLAYFRAGAGVAAVAETTLPLVLRAKRNEPFAVTLKNGLADPTSIHWFGVDLPNAMDGAAGLTQAAILPGQEFRYEFTPRRSGTSWFHPLAAGFSAQQVERGLFGMLIVEEPEPPPCDGEFAICIKDYRLNAEAAVEPDFRSVLDWGRAGRLGNTLSVNGQAAGPEIQRLPPRSRVRLRIVNACNARILPMRFDRVGSASVIAIDGQPHDPFDPLRKEVTLAPGSRFDVMIDLPSESGKDCEVMVNLGNGLPLIRLAADGTPVEARPPVRALADNGMPPGIVLQNADRAELHIAGGLEAPQPGGPAVDWAAAVKKFPDPSKLWRLNHGFNSGFAGKPLMRTKAGKPIVIAIANASQWAQVIHTHGHHFRYLHPFDDGWEPYWLDTVIVPPGRTVRIASFAHEPGRWAIRSSILEHFEAGIATWIEVA